MDYNHPDLIDNIWTNSGEIPGNGIDDDRNGYIDDVHGWNFSYNNNNPIDDNGHGTHVAGTIGAKGNNGIGVAGVAWNAKIMPLKALDSNGEGFTSDIIQAVNYAAGMGVMVTNNSYGSAGYSQTLHDAIAASNHVFVAASGNSGADSDKFPEYPASYDCANIISVTATDINDALASYSNFGAGTVDIAAPGSNIMSTLPNDAYGSMSGTSMAAPHVTGAVAVLAAQMQVQTIPITTVELFRRVVYNNDSVTGLSGKVLTGGRLNIAKMLSPAPFQAVQSINITYPGIVYSHQSINLSSAVSPANATDKRLIWTSNNPAVAQVSNGKVVGVSSGNAVITATSASNPNVTATVSITVSGSAAGVTIKDDAFRLELIYALMDYGNTTPWKRALGYDNYNYNTPITQADLDNITVLSIRNKGISDLTGIEKCTYLQYLDCGINQISTLNLSSLSNLTYLDCSENILVALDFNSGNPWTDLYIQNNALTVASGTLFTKLTAVQAPRGLFQRLSRLMLLPAVFH